jgi:serine/threonine protein kinase
MADSEFKGPPDFEPGPRIGSDALGDVHFVRHGLTKRAYALTVLSPTLARDGAFVRRLRREARVAMLLRHAHILTVFDCAQLDDGTPYLLTEYMPWESLAVALVQRPQPPPVRLGLGLLLQLAEALEHAHRHKVLHGDLRLGNIVVAHDFSACKLTHFGLAQLAHASRPVERTTVSAIAYLAPEQLERRAVDQRTDLYALGRLAYRILTGAPPYHGEPRAVAEAHLAGRPPPLRLPDVEPHTASQIERTFRQCLYLAPADRPASAEELAQAIRELSEMVQSGRGKTAETAPSTTDGWTRGRTGVTSREALLEGVAQELVDSGQANAMLGRALVGVSRARDDDARLAREEARLILRKHELDYDARGFEISARQAIANLRYSLRIAESASQAHELRDDIGRYERAIANAYAEASAEADAIDVRLTAVRTARAELQRSSTLCMSVLEHELSTVLRKVREPTPELQRLLNGLSPEDRGVVANEVAVETAGPIRMR